jgi:hypothetical protein
MTMPPQKFPRAYNCASLVRPSKSALQPRNMELALVSPVGSWAVASLADTMSAAHKNARARRGASVRATSRAKARAMVRISKDQDRFYYSTPKSKTPHCNASGF